ncbi:S-layer homology domain-containing protein [Cohnella sp.]|uniref:S-layer homology domain-containing protein n=1 Tax=Cohnella sp. TaxID=1883426 RepID=UPI00370437F3
MFERGKKRVGALLLLSALLVSGGILGAIGGPVAGTAEAASAALDWGEVGDPAITEKGNKTSIAVYDGAPYVMYLNEDGQAKLVKHGGSGWETVGNPVEADSWLDQPLMKLDGSGTPYVAYMDGDNDGKATMKKFNGSGWETIGHAGFTAGAAYSMSVSVSVYGTPYLAYRDRDNGWKGTVMKHDGSDWVTVGPAGFSGPINGISVAADSSDHPYVVYQSTLSMNVMKYDGNQWVPLSSPGTSFGGGVLAIDNDIPYLIYKDNDENSRATVKRYDGNDWVAVGDAGFSPDQVDDLSLYFDRGTPYAAFKDWGNGGKATVMKYDGAEWITVGRAGLSAEPVSALSLAVSDGIPYLSYREEDSDRIKVMSLYRASPELAGDTIDNDDGHDIEITFPDDAVWRSAVTAVKADGVALAAGTEYEITEGKITISQGVLTPGIALISVSAEGYVQAKTYQIVNDTSREWHSVGGLSSFGEADAGDPVSFSVDGGIPYAAYTDEAESRKATVAKYQDGAWHPVGGAGFSDDEAYNVAVHVEEGMVYAAYFERVTNSISAVRVMKHENGSWEPIGSSPYEDYYAGGALSVTVDNGIPYVAYPQTDGQIVVQKYISGGWVPAIEDEDGPRYVNIGSLEIEDGVVYLGLHDNEFALVAKYEGGEWGFLGGMNPFEGYSSEIAFAIDGGVPYAVFSDRRLGGAATVVQYEALVDKWLLVGDANLSTGQAAIVGLSVDDGTPYAAFYDEGGPAIRRALSTLRDLTALHLSSGALDQAFDPATTDYTATVASGVASITVTPTAQAGRKASVTVNGEPVASGQISRPIDLVAGSNTITVEVVAQNGAKKNYTIAVTRQSGGGSSGGGGSPGNGGGGGGSVTPAQPDQTDADLAVTINGNAAVAVATGKMTDQDGRTVLTATVNAAKLIERLKEAGDRPIIVIPVSLSADKVSVVLTGDAVKALAEKGAVLDIRTPNGSYRLPAAEVPIERVLAQFGAGTLPENVTVQADIVRSDGANVERLRKAAQAGGFSLVASPIDFEVTASSGGRTIRVTSFNSFVEREIPIPQGTEAGTVTTAVVLHEDGTIRSVPTKLKVRNGASYAVINSLTNSTYSLVSNPVAFEDVERHWAKGAVNGMGSRMVVGGVGDNQFGPNRDITRAEFAAMIVRALGLRPSADANVFKDVKESDWYGGTVQTAHAYRLISGFEDGTFRPNDKITREQAMTMIANAMKLTGLSERAQAFSAEGRIRSYGDAGEISAWAIGGVAQTIEAGIVTGTNDGLLAPKELIRRAEVAVMIERLLQKSGLI